MRTASKIILTNKENQVLLQLRSKDHSYSGSWALFGGHIENSETPEQALIREIKQEINYSLTDYQLIKASLVKNFGKVYWFHGTIDAKLSELTLNEGDDLKFFTYEELRKIRIAPESKKRLIEYFEGRSK